MIFSYVCSYVDIMYLAISYIYNKNIITCHTCNNIAPSQVKESLTLTPSPDWPFQKICADYFAIKGHSYLNIVDRLN